MINAKWLFARWTLGSELVRQVLLSPFLPRDGAKRWRSRMRKEALAETPQSAWDHLAKASGCIACGICDAVAQDDRSIVAAVVGVARRPEDAPLALEEAANLRALAKEVARICPARVDVEVIAALIEDNAKALERA